MKKIFSVLGVLLITATTQSQVIISVLFGDKLNTDKITFGLLLGNAWNSLTGYSTADAQSNFNLGLFLNWKLEHRFFIQFDALAKFKLGAKGLPVYSLGDPILDSIYRDGTLQRTINCLALATTVQYRVWKYLNAELGPQVSLRLKASDLFKADHEGGSLKFEKDISASATRFDVGVAAGLSWQFNKGTGVKTGVRYYNGFVDIFNSDEGHNLTRTIQLNLYIPVGREKAKKKNR
jgi:Outer membrane protein beta-barrel domain